MTQYNLQDKCVKDSELSKDQLIRIFNNSCVKLEQIALQQYEKSKEYGAHVRNTFNEMLSHFTSN